jgi:hypothetical protein
MRAYEGKVFKAVDAGEVVQYTSTPIYDGDNLVPYEIQIEAHGNRGFKLFATIPNPAAWQ